MDMKITSILDGFKVEKATPGTKQFGEYGFEVAYFLTGKRGAVYILSRYGIDHDSSKMFVVNSKGNVGAIHGNYTFDDRDGDLDVWNQSDELRSIFGKYKNA